ncbi:type II secretion system F family protein [Acetobacterium wieringae]|jgi:hypothetical protein|uniref:Flp pilus assembly protein TadB n=1 Tax=Acetobacterium wieringae TaxID=52694 RepID=A0A1F2PL90_9FIRM|nr:hypothetical protein [Acetobacterium wieringae]OFV71502.1 hypothetical protein ACWI_10020 [Acetobacterium wieringae]
MKGISFFIFTLLLVGLCLLFNVSPFELTSRLMDRIVNDKSDIQSVIKKTVRKDRRTPFQGLTTTIREAQMILKTTNRESVFAILVMAATILFIVGLILGLLMENILISAVLGVGMSLFPFWYIKLAEITYRKELNDELNKTLSIITTSYSRSRNIVKAIEENLHHMNPPLLPVFEAFVFDISYITADIPGALLEMSEKIDNQIYKEWCRAVIACQDNPNLIETLPAIVRKFTDIKEANDDFGTDMHTPLRIVLTMVFINVGVPVLFYFINRTWYLALVDSWGGKIILAVVLLVIFISLNAAIKDIKPIEYSR